MWAKFEAGNVSRVYKTPQPVSVDGIQYPLSVFSNEAKLSEIGIYPLQVEDYDSRYYKITSTEYSLENGVAIERRNTAPVDVVAYKKRMLQKIKAKASSLLQPTDWMVIRAAEGGASLSTEVAEFRAGVRTTSNEKEADVKALNNIEAIIAYENTDYVVIRYIEATNSDGVVEVTTETSQTRTQMNKLFMGWPTPPGDAEDALLVSIDEV